MKFVVSIIIIIIIIILNHYYSISLFRGIFAFIANRDLPAQSDFYFFHDSKIVQVEKNFWMMGFMPARARPRSLRRSPVDADAQPASIILTALGKTPAAGRVKKNAWKPLEPTREEKQLFRGIFAFIANRDLFAQSDFYFFHDSLRSAMPAPEKLYRLRRSFGGGFHAGARPPQKPATQPRRWENAGLQRRKGEEKSVEAIGAHEVFRQAAAHLGPALGRNRQQQTKESLKSHGVEKRRCIRNGKGKEKQLFRGIFAFIANRDLFAQSDFYFFHDSLRSAMPAPEKLYRLRRTMGWKKEMHKKRERERETAVSRHFRLHCESGFVCPIRFLFFPRFVTLRHAGARKIVQVEKNFWMMGFMPARARPRSLRRSPVDKQLFRGIFAFIANRDLFAQSDFYFFHDSLRSAMPAPEKLYRLRRSFGGGNGKGKEKQLFRGIFAFIANRDLFAQSDFYFFHDSLRSAMPAPEKLYRLRRRMVGFMPARAAPEACDAALFRGIFAFIANRDLFAQSDFYFFHDSLRSAMPAPEKLYRLRRTFGCHGVEKRRCIRNGKGKEKQLFRGIFAFIANRDLFAQSDFYFFHDSLRSAMPAPEKLYRLRRSFGWWVSCRRAPQKPATQPVDKQLFRGIFAFIANRDLFAQSDFYFFHDSLRSAMPAPEKLYRLRRSFGWWPWGGKKEMHKKRERERETAVSRHFRLHCESGFVCPIRFLFFPRFVTLRHAGARKIVQVEKNFWMMGFMPARARKKTQPSINGKGKEKQLFRGIFAFIANRVEKKFWVVGFMPARAQKPATQPVDPWGGKKEMHKNGKGKETAVSRHFRLHCESGFVCPIRFLFFPRFVTLRHAGARKIVQVEKNFWMMGFMPARAQKPATQPSINGKGKEKQLFRGIFAFIANQVCLPNQISIFPRFVTLRHAGARKIVQVEKNFDGGFHAGARPRSLRRSPSKIVQVEKNLDDGFHAGARPRSLRRSPVKKNICVEAIDTRKEKQLFRGIFAFIANRDLFAQSDFYFFHDSLRSAMPAPEKLYRLRRSFGWWPWGGKKEMHKKRKGKRNSCLRHFRLHCESGFAQSDFYFSTIVTPCHAGARKIVQVEKKFWVVGFMPARARPRSLRRSPVDGEENICVEAIEPTRFSAGITAAHLGPRAWKEQAATNKGKPEKPWGGKRRCIRNGKGKEKQLFRGIFAFIANRDLFAQSDFYFFHDSSFGGVMPARARPEACDAAPSMSTHANRHHFLTALGKTRNCSSGGRVKKKICVEAIEPTRNGGKEKQLFRGIFAFIANRDLFAQSDFYFFHDSLRPPCRRQKIVQKQLFRGIFAFESGLFAQSDFYFSTIRYAACHAGARKLY
eukprot:gene2517-1572_t